MPDTDYGYALKMGRKRYQDALARGEYPYLPVLDNIQSVPAPLPVILCPFCRNGPNLGLNGHPFTSIR